jgi:SAM-dependent methyltransferase
MPDLTPQQAVRAVADRFPFQDYVAPPFEGWLNILYTVQRHLPPGSRVLDFGSGPADKAVMLQLMGYRCAAIDDLQDPWHLAPGNRERILAFARDAGVDFHLSPGPGAPLPFQKGEFDMVMSHNVLEHLHDSPRDLLNALLELVKPQGLLYLTVPNIANIRKRLALLRGRSNLESYARFFWTPGPFRGHVREYVKDDLRLLARYLGLEILELRSSSDMLARLPRVARPVYRVMTAVFPGWRDTWVLVARKPAGWSPTTTPPLDVEPHLRAKQWFPK